MKYIICSKDKQKNLVEKFLFLVCFCLFIGFGSTLNGQNRPLDNWDLQTLNKRDLQSETYFSFVNRGQFNSTTANTLLRYGIMKNYELQINWTGNRSEYFFGNISSQKASLGIKAFLVDESKYLPGFSVIGNVNLTVDLEKLPLLPSLNILFDKGLGANFAITGNYQFILDEQSGDLSSNFSINFDAEVTSWLRSYLGLKGNKSFELKNENALYQSYLELGMLFWVAEGVTIYPFYDYGLDDDSDDIFNLGLIYLFR